MALVKCHECKNEVSSDAKNCPKCGATVRKPTSLFVKILAILFCIGFLLSLFSTSSSTHTPTSEPVKTPEQQAADAKRTAQLQFAAMGAVTLKKAMKDPDSFDLTKLQVTKTGYACYIYRAKNSFRAILPSYAVLTPKGKILAKDQDDGFSKTWNRECTQSDSENVAEQLKLLGII